MKSKTRKKKEILPYLYHISSFSIIPKPMKYFKMKKQGKESSKKGFNKSDKVNAYQCSVLFANQQLWFKYIWLIKKDAFSFGRGRRGVEGWGRGKIVGKKRNWTVTLR